MSVKFDGKDDLTIFASPAFRIEHRRSDIASGVVAFCDSLIAAETKLTELRAELRASGADGSLVIIDQSADPEVQITTVKVDNRISRRDGQTSCRVR